MSDIHMLSGAYALDALDEVERAHFEQHLARCADCRAEVASLQEAATRLAATTEVAPPASLRDSVLAGISQVRPLPPEVPQAAEPTQPPPRQHRVEPERVATVHPLRRWAPLLVAAAAAVVLGLGAAIWQPWQDDEPALTATEQVLQAPDAERVFLDLGEAGRATVVRSLSEGRAVLVTEDMVPAPEGKDYEVWLQDDEGAMIPAALMPDDPSQELLLDGDAAAATAVGITVEPDGGSPEPTSEPIALFDFSEAT